MQQPKVEVIKRFLAFVGRYIPLAEAKMATLGGEGWEARLWQQAGITDKQGWLIEHSRSLSPNLIMNLPYRYCSSLEQFPRAFRSTGSASGIDAFHLDLCGTLKPHLESFRKILPLVAKSRGKCLAITVADQRRNTDLEEFDSIFRSAKATLKKEAEKLLARFREEQEVLPCRTHPALFFAPPDPDKGARRELGIFVRLVELLASNRLLAWPDWAERYIYVSRFKRCPFRMRTYLFHFGAEKPKRGAALKLSRLWSTSPLYAFYDGEFTQITTPISTTRKETTVMQYQKLAAVVSAIGGEVKQEFEALVAAAKQNAKAAECLVQVKQLINGHTLETPLQSTKTAGAKTDSPMLGSNGENIKAQLELLRAKAEGNPKKAYPAVANLLGINGRKFSQSRNRTIGALLARTQGKFRLNFVQRAVKTLGADYLHELAVLYSKIGPAVSIADLKKEAGIS